MTVPRHRGRAAGMLTAAVAGLLAACTASPAAEGPDAPAAGASSAPAPSGASPAPFELIPDGYREPAAEPGTLELFTYLADDPALGGQVEKRASIYLPPGYDDAPDARYDVLYLMHGGGGSELSWMGAPTAPTRLPSVLDHMVLDGLIAPVIVVAPTFDTGYSSDGARGEAFERNVDAFADELVDDLLPAVESRYRTYSAGTGPDDLIEARDHRAFGGFSMGGVTTWHMLEHRTAYFSRYLPMSGDSWNQGPMGGAAEPAATAAQLAEGVAGSGVDPDELEIFAATGSGDFAAPNMDAQIAAMRDLPGTFRFSDTGFADGNTVYWVVDGHLHDYPWGHDYIYAALRLFFPARA